LGGVGAAATAAISLPANAVDLAEFGGRPGEDISEALTRALVDSGGAPVYIGPGEYRLDSPFVFHNRDKLGEWSRVQGPILIGAGSRRTIIRSNNDAAAAMEVAQEAPYRFTIGGRLEGFTLRGNPRAPKQDGLKLSAAWNYQISDVWIEGFTGNGVSIPYREDLHWKVRDFETTAGSKIARRNAKGGFNEDTGVWGSLRIFGSGIPAGTTVVKMIDETSLEMSAAATETAIRTVEVVGNTDAFQSILMFTYCYFTDNHGWGIWQGSGHSMAVSWNWTEATRNKTGGVYCSGCYWKFMGGGITVNEGPGFVVERPTGSAQAQNIHFDMFEFDFNRDGHVVLRDVTAIAFDRCRFISHYSPASGRARPEIGVIVSDTPAAGFVRNVSIRNSFFRSSPYEPGMYCGVRFGPAGSYRNIEIIDSPWIAKAPHHRLFENEPDPTANVVLREDGITAYAGRTPRAWAVLERGGAQKVAAGAPVELLFESVQGGLAGGATPHRIAEATAVAGSDQLELGAALPSLNPGLPLAGSALAEGSTVARATGRTVRLSKPARDSGTFRLLIGGVSVPYGQVYEIDASATVRGATVGSAIDLILTVDSRTIRKTTIPGAEIARQTLSLRALLPLAAGARVRLLVGHDGGGLITVDGGPDGRSLSLIAAT
jgi:hypothetical protein